MNEWLQKLLTQIKDLWSKWTIVQKLILSGIILVVVVVLVVITSVSSAPTTVPLFDVPITDAVARDEIMYRLGEENIKASVNAEGIISVEDAITARRMRAILVREDLVPNSVDPWAIFDVERWTITDAERDVNFRRALTQTVVDHIEALDDVDSANVVLTFPAEELFSSDQNEVTASVIVYQKPGSDILTDKKKIEGIQKLVMYAVEGLTADNITITDSSGVVINDFEGMQDVERIAIIEKEQKLISRLETEYRAKVLKSLQDIFTPDRVRDLNIKIDMDMSKQEIDATEHTPIVVRPDNPLTPYDDSEIQMSTPIATQSVERNWTGTGVNPQGPAGIEGQNPPVYSEMSNLYGTWSESSRIQNEAINVRQIREEKSPSIDRVTVSVNIDGTWEKKFDEEGNPIVLPNDTLEREYTPVAQDDLVRAQALIQDAIGFNAARQDSVSVQNIMFDRTLQFRAEDEAFLQAQRSRMAIILGLVSILVVLVIFIIYRLVVREMERRRRLREEEILRKNQLERERTLWEAEQAGAEVTLSVEERRRLELQENAINMAKEHPEDVALLIRTWLMED